MARKLRVQFEGAIYHVTIRGVGRRRIFDDEADRGRFLLRLGEAVEEYGLRLYLFCCMVNHAHFLIETPLANLSAFMHKLQTAYTVYYNLRHRRSGHLMQGRFGAVLVQGDPTSPRLRRASDYLLKLSRYIHLNPVCVASMKKAPLDQRVTKLREYGWSSYPGYAGLKKPCEFVTEGPLLAMMAGTGRKQRLAYRQFVEAGLAETDAEFTDLLKGARWGIGDDAFQARIRDLHTELAGKARRAEDVAFRNVEMLRSPDQVLHAVAEVFGASVESLRGRQYGCVARAAAARLLGRYAGMNQRDVADYLGMGTGSAVCRQVRRLRERMATDAGLAEKLRIAEARVVARE